jgi:GNAT superfamily N-acetyltransferase
MDSTPANLTAPVTLPDGTTIQPLSLSPANVKRFINAAHPIYARDPHWIAPLTSDLAKVFSPANPLLKHAEIQLWIASRNGQPVGRIAGIIDQNHLKYQRDDSAFFGFFECTQDAAVSKALFHAVRQWARQKGMKNLLGPMNPTTNDECGLLIHGFDSSPVFMMPYNPEYYIQLLENEGLSKAKDLLAFYIDLAKCPMNRLGRIADKVRQRNPSLSFRRVRRKKLQEDLDKVKDIYNSAWAENWGFTPMTDAEVDFLAARLLPLVHEGLIWLAEEGDEPIGFLLAMQDFNVALKPLKGSLLSPGLLKALPYFLHWKNPDMCRVITLGVKSSHRGRGLESVMLYEGLQVGYQLGLKAAEASWILEDNVPMRRVLEVFGAEAYKTYRIYQSPL